MTIILDSPLFTQIVLDPSEVAAGRVELRLNQGAIAVGPDGIDWGDAQIEQYLAEQRRGQVPVDFRIPNRQITIPLLLGADDAAGYTTGVRALQAKVALMQREGGWIKRGTNLYADIVNATLKLPDRTGYLGVEADVVLTLDAIPDFYGNELELATTAAAGGRALVLLYDQIDGDYPARARVVITGDDDRDQRGAIIALRSRHYSPAVTAALAFDATDLTPLDAAASATQSNSIATHVVKHPALGTDWTPVLLTDIVDDGPLTHTGTYRVWARAASTNGVPRLRLVWDVGDLAAPSENAAVRLPDTGQFWPVDLGEIRLDAPPIGDHRWRGQIQGTGEHGIENLLIDQVWLVPVDDGYTVLRAPDSDTAGLVGYAASDSFTDTTAGDALNGRTPPLGAAWVTSGATGDFVSTGGPLYTMKRTASSAAPRYGLLGSAMTDQRVSADHVFTSGGAHGSTHGPGPRGVIARWVDSDNNLSLLLIPPATDYDPAGPQTLRILKSKTGLMSDGVILAECELSYDPSFVSGCRFELTVSDTGDVTGRLFDVSENVLATLTASEDADLAAGGALASGKAGIIDSGDGSHSLSRQYDAVTVTDIPAPPAVVYAGQACELRTEGAYRENPDGGVYGKVASVIGDLPRLPPSGLEDRPVEVFIKTSRGDLDTLPDIGRDSVAAKVLYRPSYLFPIA